MVEEFRPVGLIHRRGGLGQEGIVLVILPLAEVVRRAATGVHDGRSDIRAIDEIGCENLRSVDVVHVGEQRRRIDLLHRHRDARLLQLGLEHLRRIVDAGGGFGGRDL